MEKIKLKKWTKQEPEFVRDTMGTEHKAWLDIFNEMKKVFCFSDNLNDKKYRKLFCLIERWAWTDRERRKVFDQNEEFRGCLWDGEEIKW